MANYDGILVRQNLSDTGTMPRTGGWTACPDIITAGTSPIQHPGDVLTTPASYATDPTQPVVLNAPNFVYIRGKNLGAAAQEGVARLFAAKQALFLYPQQWLQNPIKTQNGSETTPIALLDFNAIGVTLDPFVWVPSDIADHYCIVGFISTAGHTFESQKPPNAVGSIDDLAAWIAKTGGTGWHNVQFTSQGSPTFTNKTHYPPSTTDAHMQFAITCTACPIGSQVSFSCGKPLPDGTYINLPVSTVTKTDKMGFFVEADVPAGWESDIYYSYYDNGHVSPDPDHFEVAMSASVVTSVSANKAIADLGRSRTEIFPNHIGVHPTGRLMNDMPVYKLIPVGSDVTKFPTKI
jgi:hypothetical protein